ncbi:peptide-methionine (S)-S-oxide reductase MsrA [Geomicrobium sp. JSM 1781026]|uniref:peptide-methionine (S)-S-oxide reductase MsrA n=1 Tax=Geomicrobium sp. JSM 1781026 TaxID=3344580 RepID=UPI0035BF71A8
MSHTERIYFAGGCFWCMVQPFEDLAGIIAVTSGYTGGTSADASYERVKQGTTEHYEAVEIVYDPSKFHLDELLRLYWPQIDPTDADGQFHDRGPQYRTAIFYHSESQRLVVERSKQELQKSGRFKQPIVTKVLPAGPFYPAEKEHQQFYKTNAEYYKADRKASGRDEFIENYWHTS